MSDDAPDPAAAQLAASYARSARREADDARVKRLAGALVACVLAGRGGRLSGEAAELRERLIQAGERAEGE